MPCDLSSLSHGMLSMLCNKYRAKPLFTDSNRDGHRLTDSQRQSDIRQVQLRGYTSASNHRQKTDGRHRQNWNLSLTLGQINLREVCFHSVMWRWHILVPLRLSLMHFTYADSMSIFIMRSLPTAPSLMFSTKMRGWLIHVHSSPQKND